MGVAWNVEGMEGGNRSNAVSFWHQVRKKPELWADKSKVEILKIFMGILSRYHYLPAFS